MDRNKLGLSVKNSIMMEDLKCKFLGLINKQNQAKIPSMGLNPDLLNPIESQKSDETKSEAGQSTESEAVTDQEILEAIETIYYRNDDKFDSCRHELEKLPEILDCREVEKYCKRLRQQQQVVSKKVLQLILQKQSACQEEFQRILKTEDQLGEMLQICRTGRSNLNLAKKQFTTASLGILANYRKRQIVQELLNNLSTIKTLRTEDRLQELLNEENFPGAISLLLECQSAAQTYKHFRCVAALNGKLQDTLDQVEETLDMTLSKMCAQFEHRTYSSVQEAYKLLGKTQTAMDQLHMHFTAAIHNSAFTVVHTYVGGDTKRQYKQICQSVERENFIMCLLDLCKSLWRILSSYYQVLNWHGSNKSQSDTDEEKDPETTFNEQYVKQKLESGMVRMWHDVEIKISTFLIGTDLTSFKFEQFVQVLGMVNRLTQVGDELCGSKSEILQESMRKQCLSYFSHYHASRLDELRIFLEHDGWELCPVKSTFVASQLEEFKCLRPALNNCKNATGNSDAPCFTNEHENSVVGGDWLSNCVENGTSPFDIAADETMEEDILSSIADEASGYYTEDSEDDTPEELKREFVDETDQTRSSKRKIRGKVQHGPMVTNTTLSVLRVCGRYLQMSRLLRSIAITVIQNMVQFFELCFYAIHAFFTSDLQINSDSLYNPKLKLCLARIRETLIVNENPLSENRESERYKVHQPQLSTTVDLSKPSRLFGLTERVVGVESLIFLGHQYECLRPYLEHLISVNGQQEQGFLNQFYSQTIASAVELRKPIFMAVAAQALDVSVVLNLMNKVNWEVRDVMSQHSSYIDTLLMDMQAIDSRLEEIGQTIPLSSQVRASIWENVAHLITHTLVEGFSNAKKCSNGGRGLMQLDFTQLKSKFEKIASLRPMPHSEYVELYIKAYYIPENTLEEWVKEHKEYSMKHLVGLVSCACQNNKKTRQRLIGLIEEQRSNR
ncbi:syndetin isoform X2 [Venturia canescens]|uniref:syndetin isoform X2 n=1 Tax=Venturia canescens TaxID=32260 RepID=UPI001C9D610B|nr:syndetin isoform X2 [Venturia canescens]